MATILSGRNTGHHMGTDGYLLFSGPSNRGQGVSQSIVTALILMSAWCDFASTPYQREHGCAEALNERSINLDNDHD